MGATNPAAMRQACHLQTASVTLCNPAETGPLSETKG